VFVVLDKRAGESELGSWVIGIRSHFPSCPGDLLTKCTFGPPKLSAVGTANGNGCEIELQSFVPELLLGRTKYESLPALNAAVLFVQVEILGLVVQRAKDLLRDISGNGAGRKPKPMK
jgi:hypothetical protein